MADIEIDFWVLIIYSVTSNIIGFIFGALYMKAKSLPNRKKRKNN